MAEAHRSIAVGLGALAVVWIGVYWGWSPRTPGVTFAADDPEPTIIDPLTREGSPTLPRIEPASTSRSESASRTPQPEVAQPVTSVLPSRPIVIDQSAAPEQSGSNAEAKKPTRIHVVRSGENLSSIAKKVYGKASLYTVIYEANRDTLRSPDDLKLGQRLIIPSVD